jgi:zinc transporter
MIEDIREAALRPGLVWGFDFVDGQALPVRDSDLLARDAAPRGFRWLHFNLADQRTMRWLAKARPMPPHVAELFGSSDQTQRFVIDEGVVGLVAHDLELEFQESEPSVGVLRVALGPSLVVTGRHHPLRSAEAVKHRIDTGAGIAGAAAALELIFTGMCEAFQDVVSGLDAQVQAIEDGLLKNEPSPDARTFLNLRLLMVRVHRALNGLRAMLDRAEDAAAMPPPYVGPIRNFAGRLGHMDSELQGIQSQLRLLRDELDLQATQRTDRNLYFLSVLTALFMPATLVTGIFGMNTGGLLWLNHPNGSVLATLLAIGSAGLVYLVLRFSGFIRR